MSDRSNRFKGFTHPTPEEMGVSPEAATHAKRAAWYVEMMIAIAKIMIIIIATAIYHVRRGIAHVRSISTAIVPFGRRTEWGDREMWVPIGAAFGFMLVVATAALAWAAFSKGKGTDPPEGEVTLEVIVAQDGDNYFDLAQRLGIPWEDLVEANLPLVDENTAWCLARDMPAAYYQGKTTRGNVRRTDFCELTEFGGKRRAIATLRPGQHVNVPYRDGSVSGEEASMALTDQ